MPEKPKVLVVGLGISGMASAISLKNNGWDVTVIERAPERRTGGYFIELNDLGKGAAEKLGVKKQIHTRTPQHSANWHMTKDGSRVRVAGFADQPTKPETLLRGDIEEGLWSGMSTDIKIRFGTTVTAIQNFDDRVVVKLKHGQETETEETYDLLVGADGMRSTVRKFVFGPHEKYMHPLGIMICAFLQHRQITNFAQQDGIILNDGGRSLYIFPLEDLAPTALFIYRTKDVDAQFAQKPVATLRKAFAGLDDTGIVDASLKELEDADKNYLFDSVNRVKMDSWHKGRTVLVGDSAWCLTLFSGVGASMGMRGGAELGEALANRTINERLHNWEQTMRPLVKKEARLVWFKSQMFVPSSSIMFGVRRLIMRLGGMYLHRLTQLAQHPA